MSTDKDSRKLLKHQSPCDQWCHYPVTAPAQCVFVYMRNCRYLSSMSPMQVIQLLLLVILFYQWTPHNWLLCNRTQVTLSSRLGLTVSYRLSCFQAQCSHQVIGNCDGEVLVDVSLLAGCIVHPADDTFEVEMALLCYACVGRHQLSIC